MKKLAVMLAAGLAVSAFAQSSNYVRPHVNKNGTYVEGHMRTNPDSSRTNNYGSQGNVNPYTGQAGTVNPYSQPSNPYLQTPSYGAPARPAAPCYGIYCK